MSYNSNAPNPNSIHNMCRDSIARLEFVSIEQLPTEFINYNPFDMRSMHNEQYRALIMDHVIRPYQTMLGNEYSHLIKKIVFKKVEQRGEYNYCDLILQVWSNPKWWELIVDRLSRCYQSIDFSFFPNEAFAQTLMKALISKGVKPIVIFNDSIYANTTR